MPLRLRFLRLRVRPWLFAVTAASALVFASGAAIAGDADGDDIPDEIEDATERTLDIVTFPKPTPFGLSVASQSVGAEVDDKFRVRYEEGEFELEYYPIASSGRVAVSYSLEILNLVEWRDSVPYGVVDAGEVIPVVPLGSSGFGTRPVEGWTASSADGGNVAGFRIRSNDGGVVLALVVAQRFLRVSENKILTPMEVKVDIWANHTLSSAEARVGLELELAVDMDDTMTFGGLPWDVRNKFSVDESWINVTGGPAGTPSTVFFSWANETTVNGTRGAANMTLPEGAPGPYRMYMMYPAGPTTQQSVHHVSTLGVVSEAFKDLIRPPVPLGDAVVFASSFAAVAAIVGASMILAKRRRRQD